MKKIVISLFLLLSPVLLVNFVLASGTTGTIDSTDKYAWSENLGWINFGSTDGNVQVTDSGLSGYAWSENAGWINLNPTNGGVSNDVNGNLSGYAWGENTGWINFDPTNGGVTIDESGNFSGYAWSENAGWINFNCSNEDSCSTIDYRVKTDWITLRCGNGLIEGSEECDDGNTSSNDGCDSSCVTEFGAAGPPPTNPPQVSANDEQISYLLINSGDQYTQSLRISLSIFAQGAFQMAISNSKDFSGISWEPYKNSISWLINDGDGEKNVYIKFRSEQGGVSEIISDSIIIDMTTPEKPIIIEPIDNQNMEQDTFSVYGTAEPSTKVIITLDNFVVYQVATNEEGDWSYFINTPLKDGNHYIDIKIQDFIGLESDSVRINFVILSESIGDTEFKEEKKEEIIEFPFKEETPEVVKKEKVSETYILDKIIKDPYYLISEKYKFKIPDFIKRLPEQIREIPELPKFTFLQEIARLTVDEFVKPVVFGLTGQVKNIAKAVFVQAPKFIAKKITNSYQLVKYQTIRLAILFNPPKYEDIVDSLPPIKKEISRFEEIETEKIFFSSTHGNIEIKEEQGKLNLVAGASIKAFIKPEQNKEIKHIQGQLLFNNILQGKLPSKLFPFKTVEAAIIQEVQAKEWPVGQYVFNDDNQDGIYNTTFQIPPVEGNYIFKTIIEYEEDFIKEVEIEMLIDPEGYIYTTTEIANENIEARLPNVKTTLFWLNPMGYDWQVWSAYSYDQKNPQITDKTGQYSFLVPEGTYYLQAEKDGYKNYVSEYFEVKEGSSIHENIELELF